TEVTDKKLYLPNSENQNSFGASVIYVGSGNNIAIDLSKLTGINGFQTNSFWLRSPFNTNDSIALVANPGDSVVLYIVRDRDVSVVPALNLNLSSDIFASAADAASSSYSGYKANSVMTANTYTLRYTYTDGTDSAVINPSGTQVKVTGASDKYLMVQNSTGVYALAITSADQTVNASDIIMGSALTTFDGCKVWIESTDADRITTAKLATQATAINSVAVTDITAPVAGSTFDTTSACATRGVYTTVPTVTWKQGDVSATGNAGYNTTYTASVTLTKTDDYEFAAGVTATVNGQNATSVVKNGDGTVTITYTFPATAKAKLTNITAPTGITVASGTAYANMGLPNNVAIVTEGNTETTAAVVWNTTTPASGSYNPEVLTQQSVTLNGTVTCPSNIDQNSVPLTTTITVTISAAGIVGAPTFVPAAGTYTENQSVSLSSSTDGATIYYTTDGTTPTAASNVYSGAITVTGIPGERISTTIKAIAVKPGMQNSSVASAAYVIELPAPAPSTYAVTVNNGTGDGCYTAGATVTITADTASSGHEFDKWTVVSGGVTLASATSATTTFEMPANAVEVTATYKNKPSDQNPPTPTYTITAGAGGTHELSTDGTLTITCAGSLDKLTGIYVDDKLVNASNYTLKSGSTILTFNATYLNTLSVGTHKVKFQYSDGSVETTFVINEASTQDTTNSSKKDTTQDTTQNTTQETTTPSETVEAPKTGDSTPIVWWFIIAIISGAGVVYFGRKKKTVR
ncbi:MAG: chitobiase/beta-hexosaminidase C-terminal domain-containing protein, partial [Mageeibacillus sp.]|nr:chitobiase/beta-hexosaminidase C-terminal domain-containing protein [Mageeibacillus sp.]